MGEINIRTENQVGRITLQRPEALNALTHSMCLKISDALDEWRDDGNISMLIIDAEGEKAFCAGGDVTEMYRTGSAGNFEYGRQFWRDEYRMNAKLATYPKPVAAFMQGITMGGGVGLGCHVDYRVVGDKGQFAMPECKIGLVPDVGGSYLLARMPGHLGEYLAVTGHTVPSDDALEIGLADYYVPEWIWPELVYDLVETGDPELIAKAGGTSRRNVYHLKTVAEVDPLFCWPTLPEICKAITRSEDEVALLSSESIGKNSPLSMFVALTLVRRQRKAASIQEALELEYRVTHRIMEQGDFIEGVRARIIDKDFSPKWRHATIDGVTEEEVQNLFAPLGANALYFDD